MSNQPRTKDEIYQRIRETSKDEYIFEEMVRLGYWNQNKDKPEDPPDEVARLMELERQLRSLGTEYSRLKNENAIRKAFRKKRMLESRQKQKENKEKRIREKEERKKAWQEKKNKDILYLGKNVSFGLNHKISDLEKLKKNNLPLLNNALELAEFFDITVNQLRFLAFHRDVSTTSHYIHFKIPKKSGEFRTICAPKPLIKSVQTQILHKILYLVPVNKNAHGFLPEHSILTNAQSHVAQEIVINLDLKNFFPSIHFKRIKGVFRSLGYSESVATILGLICSSAQTQEIEMDGTTYYVAQGDRVLPQGAPTSPAITNIICRTLDEQLENAAKRFECEYSRYADDMTFSSNKKNLEIGKLFQQINYLVAKADFTIHKEKTRIMRKHKKQEVTGIIVNDKPGISRRKIRKFKALLFQIEKDGLKGKRWGNSKDILKSIKGFASYVAMVKPELGEKFLNQVEQIFKKHKKKKKFRLFKRKE